MLGRTGRLGQQGIASLRLAIEQAPWSTNASGMRNAIVDDLDVLDRKVDLSSPPAAAEARGLDLQKTSSLSAKVWNPRKSQKVDMPPPLQIRIASQALT